MPVAAHHKEIRPVLDGPAEQSGTDVAVARRRDRLAGDAVAGECLTEVGGGEGPGVLALG
jgi:hypothetical protein